MQGPGSAARWWETSLEEAKGSHSRAKQTAFTKPNCWRSWWTQSLAAHCLDISRWVEQKYRFRVWREGAPQLQQKSFLSLKWPYFGENQSNPVHLRNKHIPAHAVRAGLVWTGCLQRVYFTKYVLGRQGFFSNCEIGRREEAALSPDPLSVTLSRKVFTEERNISSASENFGLIFCPLQPMHLLKFKLKFIWIK